MDGLGQGGSTAYAKDFEKFWEDLQILMKWKEKLTATRGMEDTKGRDVRIQWNKRIDPSKNCRRTTQ
jgi:hypothetical protein